MGFKNILLLISIFLFSSHGYDFNSPTDLTGLKAGVPKCCKPGSVVFINGNVKRCYKNKNRKINVLSFDNVTIYDKDLKKTGKVFSEVLNIEADKFSDQAFRNATDEYSAMNFNYFLTEEGNLWVEIPNTWDRLKEYNKSQFCMEHEMPTKFNDLKQAELRYFYISQSEATPDDFIITVGLLVSCVFLALVLLVYGLLRELRNLSGLVLMAYVASLLGAFSMLATIQLAQHDPEICKFLTFTTYFFFLASFCWMNIMSCDIWWTFRGYAKARPIHRRGERWKFAMYCIYAWGLPFCLMAMVASLNEVDLTFAPWVVTPHVPVDGCFFGKYQKLIFLYTPMLIMILCNWVFYLMTAFNIWRLHRATAVLDSAAAGTPAAHRKQRYRFLVYLKLSVIMGINWVLELASAISPNFKGWYLSDIYNMLIGLSIFLIFVCKRKIFRMLVKRLSSSERTRKPSSCSRTTVSDVSTSNTTPICTSPKGFFFNH